MVSVIHKHKVPPGGDFHLLLPRDSEILSVQMQRGEPVMWVLCPANAEIEERNFVLFPTGATFETRRMISVVGAISEGLFEEYLGYIDTFQVHDGSLVFHLFEKHVSRSS